MAAVPPGSYLVLTHPASDVNAEVVAEGARRYSRPGLRGVSLGGRRPQALTESQHRFDDVCVF